MTVKAFIGKHAVFAYYALVAAISWGGLLLLIGGPGHVPGTTDETNRLFGAMYILTIAGPALASLFLTGYLDGRTGFRDLRSRACRWRVPRRWYALAILATPLSAIGTLFVLSAVSSGFVPRFFTVSVPDSLARLGMMLCAGVATATMEELGWTGFAIPRLLKRHSILATGLFVGFMWGTWHLLSNLWGPEPSGSVSTVPFVLVACFTFLPPFRLLMVWLYDRTHSLLLAVLMHACLIGFWQWAMPDGIQGVSILSWYVVWATSLWMAVAAIAAVSGWRLTARATVRAVAGGPAA